MSNDQIARDRIAFLLGLRAVRQFTPEPIRQAVVDDLLSVARWSGSASNRQPWELVLIRRRETLEALAAAEGYAKHLAGATLGIVLVMAGEADRHDQETFDEGRLSERLMLAAAAHGIGSCIGWFVGSGPATAKELLGIPEQRLVRTALSFGYPDVAALRSRPKPAQARKPLPTIVHEEHFS